MASRGCPFYLLMRLILNMMISVTSSGIQSIARVRFDPPYIHDLVAGTNQTVKVTVDVDTNREEFVKLSPEKPFMVVLKSIDEDIATTAKEQNQFKLGEYSSKRNDSETYEVNVTLTGHFLGKTAVKVRLLSMDETVDDDRFLYEIDKNGNIYDPSNTLDVWVIQDNKRLENRLFLSALVILIVIANMLMGCELDGRVMLEVIKEPVAPMIGFCTQFIAMPLLAWGIANVMFTANGLHSFALGLFVTGCVPGGGASNYWTVLLDGNLPVSLTMTFCSTVAALVMIPLWMWLLGYHFLNSFHPEAVIKVPYIKIISSLVIMIVPLIFGLTISHFKPVLRLQARKVMRPFIIFVLVFLLGFGTVANLYMIRLLTWTTVIGSLLLPWCGFAIGCLTAVLLRQSPPNVTSIAIETGIQNTGIAIMLLKFSFPDPDADISALIPVICASMTPVPLLFIATIHWLWKKVEKKKENEESDDIEEAAIKTGSVTNNAKSGITAVTYKSSPNDDSPLMNVSGERNILREISLS
uniref:Ileal sodium/bile acid cotransporter n=1 Tax=Elaeophora elaphi TaxID=1147741 RepID=A0A0R3RU45_9BILA